MTLPILTASRNIETPRLLLRTLKEQDIPALIRLRSDKRVNTYLDRAPVVTEADVVIFIEKLCENAAKKEGEYWALTQQGADELIGTICLYNFEPEKQQAEVGYELMPEYHGQGIMREALEAVVAFGFKEMHLQTIEAWPKAENIPSIKLLEKAGFESTGIQTEGFIPFHRKNNEL